MAKMYFVDTNGGYLTVAVAELPGINITDFRACYMWQDGRVRAGQIVAGRTEGRYTDDYAADAAYDFYRGEIDLQAFAQDIYEHPSGWRFWWHDESRKEITAACHTFDYKRLAVAV